MFYLHGSRVDLANTVQLTFRRQFTKSSPSKHNTKNAVNMSSERFQGNFADMHSKFDQGTECDLYFQSQANYVLARENYNVFKICNKFSSVFQSSSLVKINKSLKLTADEESLENVMILTTQPPPAYTLLLWGVVRTPNTSNLCLQNLTYKETHPARLSELGNKNGQRKKGNLIQKIQVGPRRLRFVVLFILATTFVKYPTATHVCKKNPDIEGTPCYCDHPVSAISRMKGVTFSKRMQQTASNLECQHCDKDFHTKKKLFAVTITCTMIMPQIRL